MQASHTPGHMSRRTLVKGAAWSAPVVALAVATPLSAASTTGDYTLGVVAPPTANTNVAQPGQTPFADFVIQNDGPDDAPFAEIAVRVPTEYDGGNPVGTSGWSLVATYPDEGGWNVYVYRTDEPMTVGSETFRWGHTVLASAPVPGSYTIDFSLRSPDGTDNTGWIPTGTIQVV